MTGLPEKLLRLLPGVLVMVHWISVKRKWWGSIICKPTYEANHHESTNLFVFTETGTWSAGTEQNKTMFTFYYEWNNSKILTKVRQ